MKKNGIFLGKTVISIIIAAICILLIAFLINQFFGAKKESEEKRRSENLIKEINQTFKQLSSGQERNITIIGLEEWYLLTYREPITLKCETGPCLCLCPEENSVSCSNRGVCLDKRTVLLNADGEGRKSLEISSPTEDADPKTSRIKVKRITEETYEIRYSNEI